jgi:hypothetical protein
MQPWISTLADRFGGGVMSTAQAQPGVSAATRLGGPLEVTVYPHSMLQYWWPVWVTGYLLALMTWLEGVKVRCGDAEVIMHPSKNLGVIYTMVFILVVVLTNATVRGVSSALVIAILLAVTFLLAYLDLWEDILRYIGYLAMYMNLGFYVFFSTAILIIWFLAVFVFDRMEYWTIRPGQVVHNMVFGGGARTLYTRMPDKKQILVLAISDPEDVASKIRALRQG